MTYLEATMLRPGDAITTKKNKHSETVDGITIKDSTKQVLITCRSGNMYEHTLVTVNKAGLDESGGGRRGLQPAPARHQIWLARLKPTERHEERTELIQIMHIDETSIRFRRLESHSPFGTIQNNDMHTFELLQFIKD